ncbi:MAG: NADH-quinone oxidoreductase subunit NuoG [Cellvibrionaceae bacterium]|nr:NADH-quinone oxidoreductase subunit NuoG [Cellvibrionaceae bacterium]
MATIFVDGKRLEVDGADNLLQACLSLGLDIPYFCWHPALGSVGACRQCAVKQYANPDDKRGRLVMSCMTPATDNTYISIDDAEAKEFRASVIEWLMTNHPHDCPVCEEGGHCHLQDMTVMTGHDTRRYDFTKRTHLNQQLGPFINHEMNRCIACYRCVRYYNDYADGTDLGVYGAHDNVYFGRVADGTLESEFSGNLTEVCPTGVFTDKTHSERYNRKWDMQFAPSICQQCSVGCNISPGERYGELRRVENRYNGSVNHYFLCDRGRFGYGYVNHPDRPRRPLLRSGSGEQALGVDPALDWAITAISQGKRVVGIGSPRASIETNFALRELVGEANFSTGLNATELALVQSARQILQDGGVATPALREMEKADAVLVLGEDVTQTAPRIALALRQAVKGKTLQMAAERKVTEWMAEAVKNIGQDQRHPLFIGSTSPTRLDDAARLTCRAAAEDLARLGFAVAHIIDPNAPAVADLTDAERDQAQAMAAALLAAQSPLVVSGTGAGSIAVLEAAANVALALKRSGKAVGISLVVPEVNSLGLLYLGNKSLEDALQMGADVLVIAENDLYRRAPAAMVDAALSAAKAVIVLDHQTTATSNKAHLLFSAASFAEADGTVVNHEGRAQRFFQVYDPAYYDPETLIKESWRWLHALHTGLHQQPFSWTHLDAVIEACCAAVPALAGIRDAAPNASFRIQGLKLAREPRRYSGRTAMRANISVHEPRASQDPDSALAYSMEGYVGAENPAALTSFAWAPGWNSPQAWNKFQDEVGGHSRKGDAGKRLIEPNSAIHPYFQTIPAAFAAAAGKWRIVPQHHIFGSEELSNLATVTAERIPAPYAALAPADAQRLGVRDSATLVVRLTGQNIRLPVRVTEGLAAGCLGLPVGLPGMPAFGGEIWAQVMLEAI